MPYAIRKRGDKYQVLNTRSGQVKGTHPTKAKATKQMRVLYLIKLGAKTQNGGRNES